MYQTADIGTKAITKAEDWLRLQRLMMIKQKGPISGSGEPAAKIGENETNKTITSKDSSHRRCANFNRQIWFHSIQLIRRQNTPMSTMRQFQK